MRRINLLPAAAPHPTGPQRGQHGRKQGVRKRMEKKMSDQVRTTKGELIKEETAGGKSEACYCGTDTQRCKEEGNLCPAMCDGEKSTRPSVFVTLSSFISPSSCTISSLLLSCRDDILCSSSSFLCLQHTPILHYCQMKQFQEAAKGGLKDS